jgi:uncharacterized membrane protein
MGTPSRRRLLIGSLGALTDTSVVQASLVRELSHVNPRLGIRELYQRGMNVGYDHVGSLVNTLVLAYTGAALPLFLLLNLDEFSRRRSRAYFGRFGWSYSRFTLHDVYCCGHV